MLGRWLIHRGSVLDIGLLVLHEPHNKKKTQALMKRISFLSFMVLFVKAKDL
jgi:hypothetical protein